jgi:hypothetical protein
VVWLCIPDTVAKHEQIENNFLENMETQLVSGVQEPYSYFRSLQRKLAYELAEGVYIISRFNSGKKSAGKLGFLLVDDQQSLLFL